MAINQVIIFYVPMKWGTEESRIGDLFDEDGYFCAEKVWNEYHDGANPFHVMNATFNTNGETFWKSTGGNDYSIDIDEQGNTLCIRARIDGKHYSQGELKRMLGLGHVLECNLFLPEFKKFIQPNRESIESLKYLLKRSRASSHAI